MLDKNNFKDLVTYVLVIGLFIMGAIIIKPVAMSIIYGVLLGYIFYPVYKFLLKKLKNKTLCAIIVCIGVIIIIIAISTLIINTFMKQAIDSYLYLQKVDLGNLIIKALPEFLSTSGISTNIISSFNTLLSNFIAGYTSKFSSFILNLPMIMLHLLIVIFTFFFSLKDGEKAVEYIHSVSPLKKETNDRFSKQFKDVTNSVLIGELVVGLIQGVVSGIGYFIFGIPGALLLTIITTLVGVIPLISPWIVWIPVDVYLFATGKSIAGFGLLIYGALLINSVDAFIRPLIVSRKTKMNPLIVLIGMLGGMFVFGLIGLIIGPLVLAYVLLVLELYTKKGTEEDIIFIKEKN